MAVRRRGRGRLRGSGRLRGLPALLLIRLRRLLRERGTCYAERNDSGEAAEAVEYLAHDRPPVGAGTGIVIRSGASSSLAMRNACSIAPEYSGSTTHVRCMWSQ
jgi:hypothetical protein